MTTQEMTMWLIAARDLYRKHKWVLEQYIRGEEAIKRTIPENAQPFDLEFALHFSYLWENFDQLIEIMKDPMKSKNLDVFGF